MWILIYAVIGIAIGFLFCFGFFSLISYSINKDDESEEIAPKLKTIATDEYDMDEVLSNLTQQEKIKRLMSLYSLDEVLEILGYGDDSLEEEAVQAIDWIFKTSTNDKIAYERIAASYGINNGNFQQAIAMNTRLPL